MHSIELSAWNQLKRICCYHTGFRQLYGCSVKPWKKYDRLTDISIEEMKEIIQEENIKAIIIDMDGTLKHYKLGLLDQNKEWVKEMKKFVNIYLVSNANKKYTSKVAQELEVEYIYKAKKPSSYGFERICELSNCKKEEIIVIGDAIRADIVGAKKSGIEKTISLKDLNVIGVEEGKNQYENFYYSVCNFIIYSMIGWIIVLLYHKLVGVQGVGSFLFGPFCISYGIVALIMLSIYPKIKGKNIILRSFFLWADVTQPPIKKAFEKVKGNKFFILVHICVWLIVIDTIISIVTFL